MTSWRWPLSRATTRHSRSRAPVTLWASSTSGTPRRSITASSRRPWTISRKTNASTGYPSSAGSRSGPKPATTPRVCSFSRRAVTVPRATPRRRESSRTPMRGSSRRQGMMRASSRSMELGILCRIFGCRGDTLCTLPSHRAPACELHRGMLMSATPAVARRGVTMFEEAQLYSPVTHDEDGKAVVHLGEEHPGFNDPVYRERRNEIATAATLWSPGAPVPRIDYADVENDIWRTVSRELRTKHERYACREYLEAKAALGLPEDRVPQLDEVTARLRPLTGFEYHPAAGLVPLREFYGSLADRVFHSTQYVRHPSEPLYTPEPDIIHEVIGHGNMLASPRFAELKRLAGQAARRVQTDEALQFIADVFWFTLEFGVVWEDGELRAYGSGILSSYGEIEEFRGMEIRPLDFAEMGTIEYDITKYQPVLYAADSMEHLFEAVGSFFAPADDAPPARYAPAPG